MRTQPQAAVGARLVALARDLLPPAALRLLRAVRGNTHAIRFTGDYPDWASARRDSAGYDADGILAQVRAATARVRDGQAAFERDGVAFDHLDHPFPLLACLLRIAAAEGNRLHVLDFGGSLGSTYWQCREFLSCVPALTWAVVEQAHFVECGRREFSAPGLGFLLTPADAAARQRPGVVLLSSVLPYVPDPEGLLREVAALQAPWLIVNRNPLADLPRHRLCVQQVPPSLYGFPVSYPAWIFSRERFIARLRENWTVVLDVEGEDGVLGGPGFPIPYRLLLCRALSHPDGAPARGVGCAETVMTDGPPPEVG